MIFPGNAETICPPYIMSKARGRMTKMKRIGWLAASQANDLRFTSGGAGCVTRLYGAAVRIPGCRLGVIEESTLTTMFFTDEGETA